MTDKHPEPYLQTTSSGIIGGLVYEFGHAKDDALHIYLRLWKVKEEIVERAHESFGNDHLRGDLLCNVPLNLSESEDMARAFHSAQAALVYEINRMADRELRRLKRGGVAFPSEGGESQ